MTKSRAEQQIQRAIFQHIRARGVRGLFAFHAPNGGYRTRTEAAVLKGMGVVAGVPDIILIERTRVDGLELKVDDGRPSLAQETALQAMAEAGPRWPVRRGSTRYWRSSEA